MAAPRFKPARVAILRTILAVCIGLVALSTILVTLLVVRRAERDTLEAAKRDLGDDTIMLRELLVSNAVKYTPAGGRIDVVLSRRNDTAEWRVSDTGVRLIVERSGGRIWCESKDGRGATFAFTLPMQSVAT